MTSFLRKPFLEFPLLKRELVGLLRTRKAFWLLLSVVLFSSLLPLLGWPTHESGDFFSYQTVIVFQIFCMAQLCLALLVVPAFTAGAISGERERETYELLYSTLLSPFSIIFSKTLASTGYVLILLLGAAPSVCVLYLLGGVSFSTILKCYAIIFAATVTAGLICLKASMSSRRTAHAAIRGVMWIAFWNGGLLIILLIAIQVGVQASGIMINPGNLWGAMVMALSPFSSITVELMGNEFGGTGRSGKLWDAAWFLNVLYLAVVSFCQLLYLLRKVRTPELAISRRKERRLLARSRPAARLPRRAWLARALIGLGNGGSVLVGNPVFQKDVRSEFFSRPWYRRLMFFGPLALYQAFAYLNQGSQHRDASNLATAITALGLIMLVCPAIAASAIPREIEQGNLDFLRGTLLPLRQVLRGKFLASLYATSGLVAAALLTILVLHPGDEWKAMAYSSVIAITYLFVNSLATFASVISRRTLGALVISFLSVLAVYLGWPILCAMLGEHDTGFLIATSPFMTLLWAERSQSNWGNGWTSESTLLVFMTLYGGASAVFLILSGVTLENLRARDR